MWRRWQEDGIWGCELDPGETLVGVALLDLVLQLDLWEAGTCSIWGKMRATVWVAAGEKVHDRLLTTLCHT